MAPSTAHGIKRAASAVSGDANGNQEQTAVTAQARPRPGSTSSHGTSQANPPETPCKHEFSRNKTSDANGNFTSTVNAENPYAPTPMTDTSPEDRVVWKSRLDSSAMRGDDDIERESNSLPSSPLAAAAATRSNSSTTRTSTSFQRLETPQTDIAADLWNRYLIASTGKPSTTAAEAKSETTTTTTSTTTPPSVTSKNDKNPTALPFPSSTPAPIKRDLKLRRAISCNAYWPTTANASKGANGGRKRRRLDTAQDERQLGVYRRHSRGNAEKSTKESKINALVGKIQESLDRRTAPMRGDDEVETEGEMSSSLPLPERMQEVGRKSVGVRSDKSVVEPTSLSTSDYDDACFDFDDIDGDAGGKEMVGQGSDTSVENGQASAFKQIVPAAGTRNPKPEEAGAGQVYSEFSDEELDAEFLELAAAVTPLKPAKSADKKAQPKAVSAPMAPTKPPSPKTSNSSSQDAQQTRVAASVATAPTATKNEPTSARKTARSKTFPLSKPDSSKATDDEFGFGFDDDFGDDLEEIFAELTQDDLSKEADMLTGEAIGASMQNQQQEQQEQRAKAASIRMESTRHGDIKKGSDFGDDFGFAGLDSLHLSQGPAPGSSQSKAVKTIQRYLILDVAEDTYMDKRNIRRPEKVLRVQDERTQRNFAVTLRDTWLDSPVSKDAYIHVIGEFDRTGQCIIDDGNNMLILHPDHLISATVVASSFSCMRQAVLQDRVKSTSDASKPQVYGMILHEIFQRAIATNRWDFPWLRDVISQTLERYIESLYEIQVEVKEALIYLMSKMPHLKAWAETFVRYRPGPTSLMKDRGGGSSKMSINKLLEVEEHVWSPMYGLKGNVDATVQVTVQDGGEERTLTVPFELKTGKKDTHEAHRAQTAMYSLLLSDRYDIDVTFGILYYLETANTLRIRAIRRELVQMIQQRNELAEFVRHKLDLPPMLRKPQVCNGCYSKNECFLYHKLMDDGNGETSGMGEKFTELTDHLMPAHQNFFAKWDSLITIEEKEMMKFRRELWSMLSHEREAVGRCFGGLMVEPYSGAEDTDGPKINRFTYTFVKKQVKPGFSFTDSQLGVGEPIVVSDEDGHYALANGYVKQISSKRITVAVDRRLHNARTRTAGFDAERNQAFTGVMEVVVNDSGKVSTVKPATLEGDAHLYRLDKDEFSNGMASVRNNLLCMMDKNRFQSKRLRELIIDNLPPNFKAVPSSAIAAVSLSQTNLNVDQKNAIEKVLSADDYALVLGMPGTGKTTTIAHIIRALVSKGKSVLLASYTHTAVDNILLKVRNDNFKILRLGAAAKVHPEVQSFAQLASVPKKTIEELRDCYENSQIVATTCLGVNHPIFNNRVFDYCIVDEASQITLPVCLGPIRMAQTFILVGDHYQLPPLVQNKEAQEGGLDISLFKLLCDQQPKSVVYLEHQYRMCKEIMLLSNQLIYSNHLKCGTPGVAAKTLEIPKMQALKLHHAPSSSIPSTSSARAEMCVGLRCWLRDLVHPAAKARLVNTDLLKPEATEDAKGSRIINEAEAVICAQLAESLITVGVPASEIGIVTLYRSQLALLKSRLRHQPDLEMHTADRFQGRDKEVIIMSCVRSNQEHNVGDLLRDWRRVNVAFTRARSKLLVVGSKSTLHGGNALLAKFVRLMDGKGWTYDLPPSAAEGHVFEQLTLNGVGFTQLQQEKTPDKKEFPAMKSSAAHIRSPLKATVGTGNMKQTTSAVSSSSKKVRFSQSAKGLNGKGSSLNDRCIDMTGNNVQKAGNGGLRQPQKVGPRPRDASNVVSKRPLLRDIYNDRAG